MSAVDKVAQTETDIQWPSTVTVESFWAHRPGLGGEPFVVVKVEDVDGSYQSAMLTIAQWKELVKFEPQS